ncbi:MAG TPA: DNA methyltransferase [Pyrinomonadaceae bacterium]|jgi:adenine specific DNA methylase Mod
MAHKNALHFGDNLEILRNEIKDESVDLVYLDPPFNSNATYNVLFKSPKGHKSDAQIEAFEDTWHWGEEAEKEFNELIQQPNTDVSEMMQALRRFLKENDMMAYLTMIANRLLELHRVLKETGSLYLHCDPTASHYLKIVLDGVFGKENFVNEIIWRRAFAHNDPNRCGRIHDTILFYAKSDHRTWNRVLQKPSPEYVDMFFDQYDEERKERYARLPLDAPRHGSGGNLIYEWKGMWPSANRTWSCTIDKMMEYEKAGRIHYPKKGMPRLKRYESEYEGTVIQDIWTDINKIHNQSPELLGYPTQKPLALLERIIKASSNEDDTVLDPFCGCGTAIHAAQKLKRRWIGIDITHLAISLIEKRLRGAFPGINFEVHGTPKDFESAKDLARRDKYQFQWWACSLVNANPYQGKKKGADTGIDGLIYFQDDQSEIHKHRSLPKKIVVSVKGGENVSVPMIRDLGHVVEREGAEIGLFITLTEPTRPMLKEAVKAGYYTSPTGADFPKIQILTIKGLLDKTEHPRYPDLMKGGLMFKRARKEVKEEQIGLPAIARGGRAKQVPLPGRDFSNSPLLDDIEDEES